MNPRSIFLRTLPVALLLGLSCHPILASAEESSAAAIEEVIVTAQRREQSVQDIPVAVDAFTQEFLEQRRIEDIFDMQFYTPSLVIENGASTVATTMKIRGVGTQSSISLESSVGMYVDGVARTRQASASTSLVDMERVEVLKGPQGTLFGRNAVSGAVQYVSRAPDMDGWGGWASVEAGNREYANVKGAVNIPMVEDTLAARISGSWTQRDGYIENLVLGEKQHDLDRYSVRGQLLWRPSDVLSFRLIGDYTEFDDNCCTGTNVFDGPGDTLALFTENGGSLQPPSRVPGVSAAIPQEAGPLLLDVLDPTGERFPDGFPVNLAADADDREVAANFRPRSVLEDYGVSLEANWEVSDTMTLTSLTAYREFEASGETDTDYTAYDSLQTNPNSKVDQDTFSQEFRLTGSAGDKLQYVAGFYYMDQSVDATDFLDWGVDAWLQAGGGLNTGQFLSVGLIPGVPSNFAALVTGTTEQYCNGSGAPGDPPGWTGLDTQFHPFCGPGISPFGAEEFSTDVSSQDQTNWAVFGQADYRLTEQLLLTAGLRYTEDEKEIEMDFLESSLNPGFAFFDPLNPLIPDFDSKISDDVWTGTLKATYFITDDLMVYGSYSHGYKSGGFNVSRIGLTADSEQVIGAEYFIGGEIVSEVEQLADPEFDPEYVDAYEIGFKGDFWDNRIRSNIAVFYQEFEDFQATAFVGNTFVLANAGELQSKGVEWMVQAAPTEWFSAFMNITYLDAEYEDFDGAPCWQTPYPVNRDPATGVLNSPCDNSGGDLANAPEWAAAFSFRADQEILRGWRGFAQFDARWTDDTQYGADNDPNKVRDDFWLMDASAGLISTDERWQVSIWGNNLTDEKYYLGMFNAVGREGSLTTRHSEPRMYGLTLRTSF